MSLYSINGDVQSACWDVKVVVCGESKAGVHFYAFCVMTAWPCVNMCLCCVSVCHSPTDPCWAARCSGVFPLRSRAILSA